MKALRNSLGAFSFEALPPFGLQGFFIGKMKCQEDRNAHVPSPDVRNSLTAGSARSMPRLRQDATRSTSVIRRQGNVTARHGKLSEHDMQPNILSARCVLPKDDTRQQSTFTTSNRWLRVERMTRATSRLSAIPATPEFMQPTSATDGAERSRVTLPTGDDNPAFKPPGVV